MQLRNKISNKELKEKMMAETARRITLSFYKYFPILEPQAYRDFLYLELNKLNVFGRIFVAHEGINAQISVPEPHWDRFKQFIHTQTNLEKLRLNIAVEDDGKSFWVLKVKVRKQIVADGLSESDFLFKRTGQYVSAEQMNDMIDNQSVTLVDMRNHYEYEVGHFQNAIEIPADTYREQLKKSIAVIEQHTKENIVLYCTGGIRCEKASAYLLEKGFKNVYHLEGGIIQYAHEVKKQGLSSKFIGKNFVFDNRLGERITEDIIAKCHQCGQPCDNHTNCVNPGCHLLFIQCVRCAEHYEHCCSATCQQTMHEPIHIQKEMRKGIDKGQNIFNKSRARKINYAQ
ncbi:MAG: rhodanese-related sulfurtransferase [Phycisphaerales bacterium]|nr:rhodanese-related sulfurtransferase [Phycisphaerales bacterium]